MTAPYEQVAEVCGHRLYSHDEIERGQCVNCHIAEINARNALLPRPEHAPGHPYGSQPGPGGMFARWCLRDDCDWRDTTSPTKDTP